MKKFLEFINEARAEFALESKYAIVEGNTYVGHKGTKWLVESVVDDEVVATNQETEETKTFTQEQFNDEVIEPGQQEVEVNQNQQIKPQD